MTTSNTNQSVSRRIALAGLSASSLGLALAATQRSAVAQDATPTPMADHPLVGTWIVVRDVAMPNQAPSIVVYTADGGLIDPSLGVAGVWEATGPRSGAWTLVVFLDGGNSGYVVVRCIGEVAEDGDSLSSVSYSFTIVAPDGTVVMSDQAESIYTRLKVEPVEMGGQPLEGFPTLEPAPPVDATPSA